MGYDFEFTSSAVEDLNGIIKHNPSLAVQLITDHIPTIVRDPKAAGEKKKGELSHLRAHGFTFRGVAYRLVYQIDDAAQVVTFIALGIHDEAYRRAWGR